MPNVQRQIKQMDQSLAIYKVLRNIMEKWSLEPKEMAEIIRVDYTTFQNWMRDERVPFRKESNAPREEILKIFLKIDNSLSKIFQSVEDQQTWLKTVHPSLHFVPLNEMRGSFEGLVSLKNYLHWSVQKGA